MIIKVLHISLLLVQFLQFSSVDSPAVLLHFVIFLFLIPTV